MPGIGVPVGAGLGVAGLLANTLPGLAIHWGEQEDYSHSFDNGAKIGQVLGRMFTRVLTLLTAANDEIFTGNGTNPDQLSIALPDYFRSGAMLEFDGIAKADLIGHMTGMFLGYAINYAWRLQKVFIIGGGDCGVDDGLGMGPAEGMVCIDDAAWYIYHWEEKTSGKKKQRAGMVAPHGMKELGEGDYDMLHYEDIIHSSVDAYRIAGYDFTTEMVTKQVSTALETGKGDLWDLRQPGLFTIPVCNVSMYLYYDEESGEEKHKILGPYGNTNLRWCGPICDNDRQKTEAFYKAANLQDFETCW